VRLDHFDRKARERLGKAEILALRGNVAILAQGADADVEKLGLHGVHGHFEKPMLTFTPSERAPLPLDEARAEVLARRIPYDDLIIDRIKFPWCAVRCNVTPAELQTSLDRYTGTTDPGGGPIRSRHISHPDNTRAVNLLIADLRALGYCAFRHDFTYSGHTYSNVIADRPGLGLFELSPDIREIGRRALVQHALTGVPLPEALHELPKSFPRNLKPRELERVLALEPWFPWWRLRCLLPGLGSDLVLVGCHLDSTAGSDPGYNPATGAAPGVDDDASGMAAALAIAKDVAAMGGCLTHSVRFCFFNAEEQGRVGSQAYAAYLRSLGARIRAVVCMDMVGYNSDARLSFEIHAGATNASIRDASLPIADCIAAWGTTYGVLDPAQIYRGTLSSGGVDRAVYDGAIGRSDHSSFHAQGYPAVVVSEDFFANMPMEPASDGNPQYHRASDTVVDTTYLAAVARAVGSAVIDLAR
jgi:hypothetical protein